jgi:dolichol-phosphate mannosyltransferase
MSSFLRQFARLVAVLQLFFAARVVHRMIRTSRGLRIPAARTSTAGASTTVIVPVLNEVRRLQPCLASLAAQSDVLQEILVVDGGSIDGTQDLVRQMSAKHPRIRLVEVPQAPPKWNGKAWNLKTGLSASTSFASWILCIDADVRVQPNLVDSLIAFAEHHELQALSVATQQELGDRRSGLLHPSMLTTLVYRFGIPGQIYDSVDQVQASGQCFLASREVLEQVGGFDSVAVTNSEDIALAREIVKSGNKIGFFETDDLATVRMYDSWLETWQGWSRSLPARDRSPRRNWVPRIAEVFAVQAMPIPVVVLHAIFRVGPAARLLVMVNISLAIMRLGVLAGTRRAYVSPPRTYWLSPLMDLPVAMKLATRSVRRTHTWRGRTVLSEE